MDLRVEFHRTNTGGEEIILCSDEGERVENVFISKCEVHPPSRYEYMDCVGNKNYVAAGPDGVQVEMTMFVQPTFVQKVAKRLLG